MALTALGFLVAAVYVTIDPDPPGKMVVYEGRVQEIGLTEIHPTGYTAYETVIYLKMSGLDEVLGIKKRYSQDLDQYRLQIKNGDVIKVHFWSPGWQDSRLNFTLFKIEKQGKIIMAPEEGSNIYLIMFIYGFMGICLLLSVFLYRDYKKKFGSRS